MSNINWNQFTNNLLNNYNSMNTANTQNAQLGASSLMQEQTQSTPLSVLLPNYIAQLSSTTTELAELNQQQTVNMLKDLLQFPKNFEQLLSQLTTNPENTQQNTLLLLLSTVDLTKLSSLLQSNSKQASSNLYQILAQYNQLGVSIKDEQLGQISKLISFVSASSNSDVQSLKTLMLMYLPWLPLTDPNAFKLEISGKNSEGGAMPDDSVTVLIATENYGNLQANIFKTNDDGIKIELISSETFPQNDFKVLMQQESKKYNININFELSIKEAFNKKQNEKRETQVCMNTSIGVNPFLLLISNSLIKNVHTIDCKEKLQEKRKEKLNNGKS
jgi:hypothetical protein